MISKINLQSEVCVKYLASINPTPNTNTTFVAEWELEYCHCECCGKDYNYRLFIREVRPVLPIMDDELPTLWIIPGGNLSPRGAFGWRSSRYVGVANDRFVFHSHYHIQSEADLLFLTTSDSKVEVIKTRRYLNQNLWPDLYNTNGNLPLDLIQWFGMIGYVESSESTVYLANGAKFLKMPEYRVIDTIHKRCHEDNNSINISFGCQDVVVRKDLNIITHVNSGKEYRILPPDFKWEGTDQQFDHYGGYTSISDITFTGWIDEIFNSFDKIGILAYFDGDWWHDGIVVTYKKPMPEEAEWVANCRVAFQWKEIKEIEDNREVEVCNE